MGRLKRAAARNGLIKPDEWEPAVRIMNRIQKLPRGVALLTFAGLTALAAGTAMGDVIYRKDPNKTLVSKNSMIGLFVPTIDIRQWTPGMPDFRYSMRVLFEGTGASISAIVQGNTLTDWGSTIPSPCLAVDGDLDIEGWTLGPVGTTTWRPPQELNPDTLKPASLTQSGSFGDFDLDAFAVGIVRISDSLHLMRRDSGMSRSNDWTRLMRHSGASSDLRTT
jgi:hypothetical protein